MKQVSEIALEVFERDRFEFNLVSAGYESDSDSSDDESDSSDDESEDDQEQLKARLKAHKSSRTHKSKARRAKAEDPAEPVMEDVQVISPLYSSKGPGRYRKTPPGESEVEDLIKKMSQMNIKDPDYAVTYYRAFCLDERIAKIFPEPAKQAIQPATREFPRTSSSTLPRANIAAPVAQNSAPSSMPSFPTRPPLTCYGCGAQGHGLRNCPPMIDLANKGIIARDSEGHYFWPNGQRIQRNPGEDYVPAIHRMRAQATPVVSNFITSYEVEDSLTEDEEDEEDADEFLADLDPLDVLAAERAPKTVTMTRKDVLGKPSAIRTRPALNEDTGRRTRSKGSAPDPKPAGSPSRARPSVPEIPSIVNPIPADVRPRHEFTAEDIAMADEEPQGPQKASTAESKSSDRAVKATRAFARQAEILDLMEQEALFRQGMQSTFEISFREYLAVSKFAREQLLAMFKGRSMKIASENAVPEPVKNTTVAIPQSLEVHLDSEDTTRGPLIVVPMRFGKEIIHAVVDSGSQLNIIHAEVYKKCIRLPVDTSKVLTMNDANGGSGELRGYVADVHLTCGSVDTVASLYLGHKAPFNLLLGRPWQRANRVSIEERDEGTYLVFRPRNENTKYELLVLESVNRPEQVLRSVFRKEDFAVNMIKPSTSTAAHSFASFIHTEPFSDTQLTQLYSGSQTSSSARSLHSSLHNTALIQSSSQATQSNPPSVAHKVTESLLEDMLPSDERGDLTAPRETNQQEASSPTVNSPGRSHISPSRHCLHGERDGELPVLDDGFCIKCWGEYLDRCLAFDELEAGAVSPLSESWHRDEAGENSPERRDGHGVITEWGGSLQSDCFEDRTPPSSFNMPYSTLENASETIRTTQAQKGSRKKTHQGKDSPPPDEENAVEGSSHLNSIGQLGSDGITKGASGCAHDSDSTQLQAKQETITHSEEQERGAPRKGTLDSVSSTAQTVTEGVYTHIPGNRGVNRGEDPSPSQTIEPTNSRNEGVLARLYTQGLGRLLSRPSKAPGDPSSITERAGHAKQSLCFPANGKVNARPADWGDIMFDDELVRFHETPILLDPVLERKAGEGYAAGEIRFIRKCNENSIHLWHSPEIDSEKKGSGNRQNESQSESLLSTQELHAPLGDLAVVWALEFPYLSRNREIEGRNETGDLSEISETRSNLQRDLLENDLRRRVPYDTPALFSEYVTAEQASLPEFSETQTLGTGKRYRDAAKVPEISESSERMSGQVRNSPDSVTPPPSPPAQRSPWNSEWSLRRGACKLLTEPVVAESLSQFPQDSVTDSVVESQSKGATCEMSAHCAVSQLHDACGESGASKNPNSEIVGIPGCGCPRPDKREVRDAGSALERNGDTRPREHPSLLPRKHLFKSTKSCRRRQDAALSLRAAQRRVTLRAEREDASLAFDQKRALDREQSPSDKEIDHEPDDNELAILRARYEEGTSHVSRGLVSESLTIHPVISSPAADEPHAYLLESPYFDVFNPLAFPIRSPSSKPQSNAPSSSIANPATYFTIIIMSFNGNTTIHANDAAMDPRATVGQVVQMLAGSGMPPSRVVDRVPQPHISLPIQFPTYGQDQATLTAQRIQRYGVLQAAMTQTQPQHITGVLSSHNFVEHQTYTVANGKIRLYLANNAEIARHSSVVPGLVERMKGTAYLLLLEPLEAPAYPHPTSPSHLLLDAFTFASVDSGFPYNLVLPPGIPHPHTGARAVGLPASQATPTPPSAPRREAEERIIRGDTEPVQPTPPPPSTLQPSSSSYTTLTAPPPRLGFRMRGMRGSRRGRASFQAGSRRSARLRGVPPSEEAGRDSEPAPDRQDDAVNAPEMPRPPTPFPPQNSSAPAADSLSHHSFPSTTQPSTPPGLPRLDSRLRQRIVAAFRRFEQRHGPGASANTSAPSTHPDADGAASDAPASQTNATQPLGPTIKVEPADDSGNEGPARIPNSYDSRSPSPNVDAPLPGNQLAFLRAVREREQQLVLTHPAGKQVRVLEALREEPTVVLDRELSVSPAPMNSPEREILELDPLKRHPSPELSYLADTSSMMDVSMADDTQPFHFPSPATSLPTPHASSPETSEETSGRPSLEPVSEDPAPACKFNVNETYSTVDLQAHITQLFHQIASETAAKEDEEATTASSLPQDSSSLAPPIVNLPQGAKKPRFGSPIGSKMDRRKAIRSRGSASKGKGPEPSGTVNSPPLQRAFHVWKSESGGPPIIIVDDSNSEDLFRNAVVVEEGEDSLVLQVPDSQGARGLAAAINAANFHNQAMMDEALEENKENVPPEDKAATGMETRSSMCTPTPPSPLHHSAPIPSPRTPQEEYQDFQGTSSPLATPSPSIPTPPSPTQDPFITSTSTPSTFALSLPGERGEDQDLGRIEAGKEGYTLSTTPPSSSVSVSPNQRPTSFSHNHGHLIGPISLCLLNPYVNLGDFLATDFYLEIQHDQPDVWGFSHAYSTLVITEGMPIAVTPDVTCRHTLPSDHPYANSEGNLTIPTTFSQFDSTTKSYPRNGAVNVMMRRGNENFGRWQDDGDIIMGRIALLCKEFLTREYVTADMWDHEHPTLEEEEVKQLLRRTSLAIDRSFDYVSHHYVGDSHKFVMDWSKEGLKKKIPHTPTSYGESTSPFVKGYPNPWVSNVKTIRCNPWNPKITSLRHLCMLHIVFIRILTRYSLKPGFWHHIMSSPLISDSTRHYFLHHCHIFRILTCDKPLVSQGFSHTCFHSPAPHAPPISPYYTTYKGNPLLTAAEDEYLGYMATVYDSLGRGCLANAARTMRGLLPDLPESVDILFEGDYLDPPSMFDGYGHRRPMSWRVPL
ncbi:hypothetical protein EYR38_003162 [Pleurotus pulmonarius]|nr:hypothetical protein EYR38_003162 [Pleurotus pulmonarius]